MELLVLAQCFGLGCNVLALGNCPSHDTGSAFLAVPARDDNAVYLSSGTWSLLGVENEMPITTAESCAQNFTNEGGAWYPISFVEACIGR